MIKNEKKNEKKAGFVDFTRSREILGRKIRPYDPLLVDSVEGALVALQGCSFQGRNLGNALEVLTKMVMDKDCLRVLTISGAMVPAGMETIVCRLIEHHVVGAIVTTGANIIHSIVNVLGDPERQAHYIGSQKMNDEMLNELEINRIYDTLLPEDAYRTTEQAILQILLAKFETGKQNVLAPSEFFRIIGEHLPPSSFLRVAADNNVPIFCGATSDSELGLNITKYRVKSGLNILLDELADVHRFATLVVGHERWGTIILGGGVPRNWAQQVFPYLETLLGNTGHPGESNGSVFEGPGALFGEIPLKEIDVDKFRGYHYSVRFHTAIPHDGGLSGCTISESISWGKYRRDAVHQSVWGDSTVYFPLIMTALFQRLRKLGRIS